jgi:hypothetical protein
MCPFKYIYPVLAQFEIVKLTPEELAMGEMLINSKKVKNQLIDDSFNRYANIKLKRVVMI